MAVVTLSDYRTAVVTGASSGIGAATVQALCRYGLEVHALARREDRLSALAEATGCVPWVIDVCETPDLVEMLSSVEVDILVNNAGVGRAMVSLAGAEAADVEACLLYTSPSPRDRG